MEWINDFQVWLSESQSLKNAQNVVDFLYVTDRDWSKESLSAMIGNMRHESSVNPNMYEYGQDWADDRGFGLVQWTPRSKYWNWALQNGYSEDQLRDGNAQLDRIDFEVDNNIQYIANGHEVRYGKGTKYNFSFADFRKNKEGLNVDQLTEAFMWNYEGPNYTKALESLASRQAFSNKAYNDLVWKKEDDDEEVNKGVLIGDVLEIVNNGETYILTGISDLDIPELDINIGELFDPYLFKMSALFYSNALIKATIVDNRLKLQSNGQFNIDLESLLLEYTDSVKNVIIDGFDKIVVDIKNLKEDDPLPPVNSTVYFPVNFNATGINFWTPPYDLSTSQGRLKHNMDFGTRTNGNKHNGYDVGGGGNEHNIYSVADGEVIEIDYKNFIGHYIIIKHKNDEYYSLYQHLKANSIKVNVGDTISGATHIATMGSSGGDYSIHLHFEISKDGTFWDSGNTLDPKPYLGVTGDNTTTLTNPIDR